MQTDTSSAPVDTAARARTVRASYSMANLVRRALIGYLDRMGFAPTQRIALSKTL